MFKKQKEKPITEEYEVTTSKKKDKKQKSKDIEPVEVATSNKKDKKQKSKETEPAIVPTNESKSDDVVETPVAVEVPIIPTKKSKSLDIFFEQDQSKANQLKDQPKKKDKKQKKRSKKETQEQDVLEEPKPEVPTKKLTKKEIKAFNQEQKKLQKKNKGKSKQKDFTNVKEENLYRYGKQKFSKVEDFIKYCNENYKDMDQIAATVLKDKQFHGWISKRSGKYKDAFAEFLAIKEKIEKL